MSCRCAGSFTLGDCSNRLKVREEAKYPVPSDRGSPEPQHRGRRGHGNVLNSRGKQILDTKMVNVQSAQKSDFRYKNGKYDFRNKNGKSHFRYKNGKSDFTYKNGKSDFTYKNGK
jgi:hypothetical protein